ncbi:MAG: hypothetical protein Q9181_008047 [Wetmoreana brouardii]
MRRLQDLEMYVEERHQKVEPGTTGIFHYPGFEDYTRFASRFFEISSSHQALRSMIVEEANNRWNAKTIEWQQKTQQRKRMKEEVESIDSCTMYINALAVVELQCPEVITARRKLTWMIVNDLGRRQSRSSDSSEDTLHTYSGLRRHYKTTKSRLVLGSITKSVTVSQYRRSGYPVALEDLRSDHALQWKFYDKQDRRWIDDQLDEPSFSRICQISLPEGPYKNLEDAVNSTSHTQNDILAAQTDCSAQLSLHEYLAFGSLRADGELTQWLNICPELTAPNLTWNTESVCTRRLALGNPDIVSSATALLQHCRSIIRDWTTGLQTSLRATTAARQIKDIQLSLLRAELLAKVTFDVDERYLGQSMGTTEDLECWTTNSIIVHNNTPGVEAELPADLRRLLVQDRQASHTIYERVRHLCAHEPTTGLDNAVLHIWSAEVLSPVGNV